MQVARDLLGLFGGHLGVCGFAFGRGVERGAAVVAVFEREAVLEHDDLMHAGFAQHGIDLTDAVGVFVFGAERGQTTPWTTCS